MANILVVDDNFNFRRVMKIHLENAGFTVYEAENGHAALEQLEKAPIHLLIADIMMPGMDGYELTGELRGGGMNIPVMMITAKDTLEDKAKGFDSGTDDYMVKPIDMQEMIMRVKALLRRSKIVSEKKLTVGDTTLVYDELSVITPEGSVTLPQKEFYLLYHLLSYPNKIFTRQDLMDEIWGYDTESMQRTVDVHIMRLRERFGENKDFTIQTVRGLGYRAVRT